MHIGNDMTFVHVRFNLGMKYANEPRSGTLGGVRQTRGDVGRAPQPKLHTRHTEIYETVFSVVLTHSEPRADSLFVPSHCDRGGDWSLHHTGCWKVRPLHHRHRETPDPYSCVDDLLQKQNLRSRRKTEVEV